jgi:hypothetical protein
LIKICTHGRTGTSTSIRAKPDYRNYDFKIRVKKLYYKESSGIHQQRSEKKGKETHKPKPSEQEGRQLQLHHPHARHHEGT